MRKGGCCTHSPDTYKIPAVGDTPEVFNVAFLADATQPNVIHGSKAVGEPPLMLAISVREAIRDAVAAFGKAGGQVPLASPATCEAIFNAIHHRVSAPEARGGNAGARDGGRSDFLESARCPPFPYCHPERSEGPLTVSDFGALGDRK